MTTIKTVKAFKTAELARQYACRYVGVCFGTYADARTSLALIGIDLVVLA